MHEDGPDFPKDKPGYVRSANCFWYAAYFRNNNLGFRLVRTLP